MQSAMWELQAPGRVQSAMWELQAPGEGSVLAAQSKRRTD